MKFSPCIFAALVALSASAQFKITEVHTGGTDFVEITNVSGAPASIFGIGIMVSNNAAIPAYTVGSGITQQNGPYVSTRTVLVPAGGTYVFEDFGTAGATALTSPLVGLGEHTGFNFSWAGGSHGEVALYANASIVTPANNDIPITGVALDYMSFEWDSAPGLPGNPLADGYRYNPPGVGGRWLSGPVSRGTGLDDIFRIGAPNYVDTDTNADWALAVSPPHTGGMVNGPGAGGAASSGVDLGVATGGGSLTLVVQTGPPAPFAEIFTLVSLEPSAPLAGSGLVFGLAADCFQQIFAPLGTPVFHVTADATGTYTLNIPGGVPAGITFEARAIVLSGGLIIGASNFFYGAT